MLPVSVKTCSSRSASSSQRHRAPNVAEIPDTIIDWMGTGLSISQVSSDGQVTASNYLQWPEGSIPIHQIQHTGLWLREQLKRIGVTLGNVAVSLPRRHVMVQLVELPAVDDTQLPGMVALHVEGRQHVAKQSLAYDYITFPELTRPGRRLVMLAMVAESIVVALRSCIRVAGGSPCVFTVGELVMGQLVSSGGLTLMVLANAAKLELILCEHQRPLASHATQIPSEPQAIASLVESMLAEMRPGLPEVFIRHPLSAVYVAGTRASEVHEALMHTHLPVPGLLPLYVRSEGRAHAVAAACSSASRQLNLLNWQSRINAANSHGPAWIRKALLVLLAVCATILLIAMIRI